MLKKNNYSYRLYHKTIVYCDRFENKTNSHHKKKKKLECLNARQRDLYLDYAYIFEWLASHVMQTRGEEYYLSMGDFFSILKHDCDVRNARVIRCSSLAFTSSVTLAFFFDRIDFDLNAFYIMCEISHLPWS